MIIEDVMLPVGNFPIVSEKTILKEALTEMGSANLGLVCVIDEYNNLLGLITDGDLRRKILKVQKPISAFFIDDALIHAKKNPFTCLKSDSLIRVVHLMGEKKIWDMPVLDENKKLVGLLHLHPALKKILQNFESR